MNRAPSNPRLAARALSLVLALAWVTGMACSDASRSSDSTHFGGLPRDLGVVAASREVRPMSLEYSRSLGTNTGPLSFTLIGDAAVSESGLLAVADLYLCQIVLLSAETGAFLRRFGRCGSGPGEFQDVGPLTFRGDHLAVYDYRSRSVVVVDLEGQEVSRTLVAGPFVTHLSWVDDTTAVIATSVLPRLWSPRVGQGVEPGQVAWLDLRTGAVRHHSLSPPEIGLRNTGAYANRVGSCSRGQGEAFMLAVLNSWSFEAVVLAGPQLVPYSRFHTALDWIAPQEGRRSPTDRLPASASFAAVCDEDMVLYWHLRALPTNRIRGESGHLELRSYEGALLMEMDFDRTDTLFHERPVAAFRNKFFFRANHSGPYPQLREFIASPGPVR